MPVAAHVPRRRTASSDVDNHPAVITWPPFVRGVEGTHAHGVHHALRCEDVVELGLRVRRRCPNPAEGWHVLAFLWQPLGPGIRLSTVGCLRADALQAESVHPVEDGLFTCAPVRVLVCARAARHREVASNTPSFEIRSPLFTLCGGVDLTAQPGLGPYGALRLISEIAVDMRCWPTEHHVASWLTLAPNNKISGGKRLGSRTQPSANRAAKILRLAAMALVRGDHARGAFYRRLAARTDKPTAMTATARKLALLVYRMLTYNMPSHHTSAAEYDTRQRTRILRGLRKRATSLGFELVEASTGLVV